MKSWSVRPGTGLVEMLPLRPERQITCFPADSFTHRKESLFETGRKTLP